MIIDEKNIREIIRNSLIKEIGFRGAKSSSSSSSDFQKETGAAYSGPLLTVVGNKKYIGNILVFFTCDVLSINGG